MGMVIEGSCGYMHPLKTFDWCRRLCGCRAEHLTGICLHHGSSGMMSCCFFFFSVGICHYYSQAALWCNVTLHEITLCGVKERGQNPNVVKRIWLLLCREEMVTLSRTLEEIAKLSPRDHWGEYVLSTWGMLSGNKRTKNKHPTRSRPPRISQLWSDISFSTFIKTMPTKGLKYIHHRPTELFIIVDY